MPGLHFLTYCNDNDQKAIELVNTLQSYNIFDTVAAYGIEDLGEDFANAFRYKRRMDLDKFALWKPAVIQRRLNEIPEGDILIYLDPSYEFDIKHWGILDEYLNVLYNSKEDIVIFQSEDPEECYTIQHMFDYWGSFCSEDIPKTGQYLSNLLIMQNGHHLRTIMKSWHGMLYTNLHYFTDHYARGAKKYNPKFVENRGSQSILSVICKLRGSITVPEINAPIVKIDQVPMRIRTH